MPVVQSNWMFESTRVSGVPCIVRFGQYSAFKPNAPSALTVMSLNGKLDVGLISCPELLPDLWDMADDFTVGMKELLAACR